MYPQESKIKSLPLTTAEQAIITAARYKTPEKILEILHNAGYLHRTLASVNQYITPDMPQPQTIEKKVITQQPATFSHNNTTPDNPALDLLQQAVMFDTLFPDANILF